MRELQFQIIKYNKFQKYTNMIIKTKNIQNSQIQNLDLEGLLAKYKHIIKRKEESNHNKHKWVMKKQENSETGGIKLHHDVGEMSCLEIQLLVRAKFLLRLGEETNNKQSTTMERWANLRSRLLTEFKHIIKWRRLYINHWKKIKPSRKWHVKVESKNWIEETKIGRILQSYFQQFQRRQKTWYTIPRKERWS